jgi:NitT/TauT family transport system substrate-binding protein
VPNPADPGRFVVSAGLDEIEKGGRFADDRIAIAPIRTRAGAVEDNPVLSKSIRIRFQPNSSEVVLDDVSNQANFANLKELLRVSPGSTLLLRGHVDPGQKDSFRLQGGETLVRTMALKAMELSRQRAEAVRLVMLQQLKVDPKRIEAVGRGWEEPLGPDPEANRRVEVQWFMVE